MSFLWFFFGLCELITTQVSKTSSSTQKARTGVMKREHSDSSEVNVAAYVLPLHTSCSLGMYYLEWRKMMIIVRW